MSIMPTEQNGVLFSKALFIAVNKMSIGTILGIDISSY